MKLVPLGDRVVLKQLVAEETTKSGIVIPGQSKEKPQHSYRPSREKDGRSVFPANKYMRSPSEIYRIILQ